MHGTSVRSCVLYPVVVLALISKMAVADVPGIAAGIPAADAQNVIVQLFNWRFTDITDVIPTLKTLGYSHVHVSPPQKSNELIWQWWGRYQPVDHGTISGPLGTEAEFEEMNESADAHDVEIVVDTVFNHTVDVTEQPDPPFVELSGNLVSRERFPQFEPEHFHERCPTEQNEQTCWLSNNLADLKTTDPTVRSSPVCLLNEARRPSTTRSDGPLDRGTNRSGPNRCSGKVLGLIRLPSVPFLGAFSVGIARKRPRLLRTTAPSSNARTI